MSDGPLDLPSPDTITPVLMIGYSNARDNPSLMGYIIYQEGLTVVCEGGRVHELLLCVDSMLDHELIKKAVQDQDLMDRLGV